jgi:hypothetical protein
MNTIRENDERIAGSVAAHRVLERSILVSRQREALCAPVKGEDAVLHVLDGYRAFTDLLTQALLVAVRRLLGHVPLTKASSRSL